VYILASSKNGTLYVGVTNDLTRRVQQHKSGAGSKFVQKYRVMQLVYFEETDSIEEAITREKRLKHWPRQWKLNVIESVNPNWRDLTEDFTV
jgi:putative endonuclease